MCGCLVLLVGSVTPRLALVLVAIFTDMISRAFSGELLLAFMGWLLLPYTTLAYVLVHWNQNEVVGFGWFFVALGFALDLSSIGGGFARRGDARSYRYRKS